MRRIIPDDPQKKVHLLMSYTDVANPCSARMLLHKHLNEKTVKVMTKEEKYAALLPAVHSLMSDEPDEIARMANLTALLHNEFGFWWTGFYRVANEDQLVLGPFQGPLACTRIRICKGVCGTAWAEDRTVVVPDVGKFPGHIACSSESRSEIVVPVRFRGQVIAVLDIDSRELATFDMVDAEWLEKIADCIYGTQRDI